VFILWVLHDLYDKTNFKEILRLISDFFIYSAIFSAILCIVSLLSDSFNYIGEDGINKAGFDENFVSAFLLMSLVSIIHRLKDKSITKTQLTICQTSFFLVFVSLLFTGSRRGLFVLSILLIIHFINLFRQKNKTFTRRKKLLQLSLVCFTFFILLVIVLYLNTNNLPEIRNNILRNGITNTSVKIASIANPDINRGYIENFLWNKEKLKVNIKQSLINNGDFKDSLNNWKCAADSTKIKLIQNPYEGNSVLIERTNGTWGVWPLKYIGRRVNLYEGVTYRFEFMFKVQIGPKAPFNIGWWIMDVDSSFEQTLALKKHIIDTTNNWKFCKCEYTFKKSHINDKNGFFLNSQWPNTIIEIKDVKLFSNDSLKRPLFYDQIKNEPITDSLFNSRTARWDFAFKIWKDDYNVLQKLFGDGFNYLSKYSIKFHADEKRADYPHNPIISSILYSGIIGGLVYLSFLIIAIFKYYQYRHDLFLYPYFYCIVFFFMMFSSNSHFSVPLFTFLSIIPFFLNLDKKKNENSFPFKL